MTRQRLPDRRPNETFDLEFDGTGYAVTIGFFSDGRGRASVIGAICDLLAQRPAATEE